jgi:hypothetical protein
MTTPRGGRATSFLPSDDSSGRSDARAGRHACRSGVGSRAASARPRGTGGPAGSLSLHIGRDLISRAIRSRGCDGMIVLMFKKRRLKRLYGQRMADTISRVGEVVADIEQEVLRDAATVLREVVALPAYPPSCPDCGREMVRRRAGRGARKGSTFWGCRAYPSCTGTRPYVSKR